MTSSIVRVVRKEWSKVTWLFTRKKNIRGKMLIRSNGRTELMRNDKDFVMQMWERRGCIVNRYDMKEGK